MDSLGRVWALQRILQDQLQDSLRRPSRLFRLGQANGLLLYRNNWDMSSPITAESLICRRHWSHFTFADTDSESPVEAVCTDCAYKHKFQIHLFFLRFIRISSLIVQSV
ncbi:hypothetical protein VTO42DRAFT_1299 [Malbranchea cinnamomea]